MYLALNNLQRLICHKTKPSNISDCSKLAQKEHKKGSSGGVEMIDRELNKILKFYHSYKWCVYIYT